MKNINLILWVLLVNLCVLPINSQNQTLEYPFAEPGTDVSRGVFGDDDRKEVKDAEGFKDFVRATAVMIPKTAIYNNEFYAWSLRDLLKRQFGTDKFDDNVKFLDQPTVGSCTGFLIAPDVLVTAGHCINSMEDANKYVWVFDYTSDSDFVDGKKLKFKPENIFEVESIIASDLTEDNKNDYAVLKLKKKSNRAPYRFRTSGEVLLDGPINTIGCPTGLPLKFTTNATVVDTSQETWFKSDIDAFPGNSGGPVFDKNGFIEGILVRTAAEYSFFAGKYTGDYKYDYWCDCVKTVSFQDVEDNPGCASHRITKIPVNILISSVYENLEYALKNKLDDRFKSWSTYKWIFNHNYSDINGRFEKMALNYNNDYALGIILEYTAEKLSDDSARELIDFSINKNDIETLKVILDKGIFADAGMSSTHTALQNAVINNNSKLAETLIYYGADVNIKTKTNDNLLHIAAKNGNKSLVEVLVKKGVDAGAKNKDNKRPEKIAKANVYKDLAKHLKKARKGKL